MFRKDDRFAKIGKSYKFAAAHHLPNTPEYHKCHKLHGHNYKIDIEYVGVVSETYGWIRDFADFDKLMEPILKTLDHGLLNDVIPNPTAEELALWIMGEIKPNVYLVRVWETDTAFAEVINEDGLWPRGFRFK